MKKINKKQNKGFNYRNAYDSLVFAIVIVLLSILTLSMVKLITTLDSEILKIILASLNIFIVFYVFGGLQNE